MGNLISNYNVIVKLDIMPEFMVNIKTDNWSFSNLEILEEKITKLKIKWYVHHHTNFEEIHALEWRELQYRQP